jgi:hypothetical protein
MTKLEAILQNLVTSLAEYVVAGETEPLVTSIHRDGESAADFDALPMVVVVDSEDVTRETASGYESKSLMVDLHVTFGAPPDGFASLSAYRVHLREWIGAAVVTDRRRGGYAIDSENLGTSETYTDAEGPGAGLPYFIHRVKIDYRHPIGEPGV